MCSETSAYKIQTPVNYPAVILQLFSNLVAFRTYPPMKMEQTVCSETSAYKIQTPGNYPAVILQLFSNLVTFHTYLPVKMGQTVCSETSAYKIQMPGNYPEKSIEHSEQGESLKSIFLLFIFL